MSHRRKSLLKALLPKELTDSSSGTIDEAVDTDHLCEFSWLKHSGLMWGRKKLKLLNTYSGSKFFFHHKRSSGSKVGGVKVLSCDWFAPQHQILFHSHTKRKAQTRN